MNKVTAAILAGGKSSRFGRDKSLLTLDGATLTERAVKNLLPLFDEILIVSNASDKFHLPGAREIGDVYPNAGPLGGIHSALVHSRNEAVFVMACDMPHFDAALCQRLVDLSAGYDAFVPRAGDELEPLFALYRKSALPAMESLLQGGRYKVRGLFEHVKTGFLPLAVRQSGEDPFYNINFPSDYEALQKGPKGD